MPMKKLKFLFASMLMLMLFVVITPTKALLADSVQKGDIEYVVQTTENATIEIVQNLPVTDYIAQSNPGDVDQELAKTDVVSDTELPNDENVVPGDLIPPSDTWPTWLYILVASLIAVYEIVIRKIPTVRSYSILALLYDILNALIKDRSTNKDRTFNVKT